MLNKLLFKLFVGEHRHIPLLRFWKGTAAFLALERWSDRNFGIGEVEHELTTCLYSGFIRLSYRYSSNEH